MTGPADGGLTDADLADLEEAAGLPAGSLRNLMEQDSLRALSNAALVDTQSLGPDDVPDLFSPLNRLAGFDADRLEKAIAELLDPSEAYAEAVQNRDAVEAQQRTEADARSAEFVAAIEALIAEKRAPGSAAVEAANQIRVGVDREVRKRWGPWWWVNRIEMGRVVAVNVPNRVTRTTVPPAGTAAIGDEVVGFGAGAPSVGDRYPVHIPVRLPDAPTPLIEGPVPAGTPWLKAPEGKRWLYAQSRTVLYRWSWPPPVPTDEWPAETVATGLDASWLLVGASTPPGEATQIVFERRFPTGAENDPVVPALSSTMHHLDAMGFGEEVHTYQLAPHYASTGTANGPGAIANDGVAVAAINVRGRRVEVPNAHVVQRIVYERDGPQQSCCIDFPVEGVGSFHSCVFIDNFKPVFEYADPPQPPVHREVGQGLWLGDPVPEQGAVNFGLLHPVGFLFESGGLWDEHQRTNAAKKTCHGSGCHPVGGFTVGWDSYSCEYTIEWSGDIVFWFFEYLSPLHYDYGAFGAWEYDGRPAGGWAWTEVPTPHRHMQSRNDLTPAELNQRALKVQGYGCTPAGPTALAPGLGNVYTMSLDPATRELIVWYRTLVIHLDRGPDVTFHRWRAGSDSIFTASQFYAASRDGTDALIEQSRGRWAYTLDGGETWPACRPPDSGGTLNLSTFRFVDELG